MVIIKSVSGIRGTIFREGEENLTPFNVLKFATIFGISLKGKTPNPTVVLGRDGRISGPHISKLISTRLSEMGINVINIGLVATPTVGVYVLKKKSTGGIMISASHNNIEWNALKFFNNKGEFLTKEESEHIINYQIKSEVHSFIAEKKGKIILDNNAVDFHISSILKLEEVLIEKIKKKNIKIVLDGINSSGGLIVPKLLESLNVSVIKLNCEPNGIFDHNPEPIPDNLVKLSSLVVSEKADFGIAVDPDVDRLVFVCEDGSFFGEEYTIIAIGNYILSKQKGCTVSNLSSSNGLRDITKNNNSEHFYSAVGESNVVSVMKKNNAVFGGEGSGGVIFPKLHYGRDALVGIALFLSYFSENNLSVKEIKNTFPKYFMSKDKILLPDKFNFQSFQDSIISYLNKKEKVNFIFLDGLRIDYSCGSWIHIRKSNTEPIIRFIIESTTKDRMDELKYFINFYIKKLL